jgi:hypothetical protein
MVYFYSSYTAVVYCGCRLVDFYRPMIFAELLTFTVSSGPPFLAEIPASFLRATYYFRGCNKTISTLGRAEYRFWFAKDPQTTHGSPSLASKPPMPILKCYPLKDPQSGINGQPQFSAQSMGGLHDRCPVAPHRKSCFYRQLLQ